MDYETFKAINDACLVFDGKLVIDTEFRTNDVSIRAAGPLTKYSRRYYADEWTHSNFNSKEIGFELAASMLSLFDPTPQLFSEPPEGMDGLIPMYKGCKIQGMWKWSSVILSYPLWSFCCYVLQVGPFHFSSHLMAVKSSTLPVWLVERWHQGVILPPFMEGSVSPCHHLAQDISKLCLIHARLFSSEGNSSVLKKWLMLSIERYHSGMNYLQELYIKY